MNRLFIVSVGMLGSLSVLSCRQQSSVDLVSAAQGPTVSPVSKPFIASSDPAPEGDPCSPRTYGAIPNDASLDVNGIQAAIHACGEQGGGVVQLETGRYLVDRPIELTHRNLTLRGTCRNCSVLSAQGDDYAVIRRSRDGLSSNGDWPATLSNIRITELSIQVEGGRKMMGIDLSGISYSRIDQAHVTSIQPPGGSVGDFFVGIYMKTGPHGVSPYYNTIEDTHLSGAFSNYSVGILMDEHLYPNGRGVGPNANRVSGGRISAFREGVKIRAGVGNTFYGVIMEAITAYHYTFGTERVITNPVIIVGGNSWKNITAVDNQVFGGYHEGGLGSRVVFLNHGAAGNSVQIGKVGSTGSASLVMVGAALAGKCEADNVVSMRQRSVFTCAQ